MKKYPKTEQLRQLTDKEIEQLYFEAEYKYHSRLMRNERNVFDNYLSTKLEMERRGLPTE